MTPRTPFALALLTALLLFPSSPVAAQQPPPGDAYLDPGARELVERARIRRATMDTRIRGYEVRADERISAWASLAGRERLIFRRETASQINWSADTVRIEVLGARESQPMVQRGVGLPPASMAGLTPALAFDPVDAEMLLRVDSTLVLHPLNPGSEADYQFASGDTTVVRLPDGREVRLIELRITARRADPRLINGSFWLDAEGYAVVRAGFRLTTPRAGSEPSVSFLTPETTTEVDHVAIDYGLWDFRWWLPRSLVARGTVQAAGIRFPLEYERSYGAYQVDADTLEMDVAREGSDTERPCRPILFGSIEMGPSGPPRPSESWDTQWDASAERIRGDSVGVGRGDGCDRVFLVTRAEGDLSQSPAFTWSILDAGSGPLSQVERDAVDGIVRQIPRGSWHAGSPRLRVLPLDGVRFNRVEGLSVPLRGTVPFGPGELRGELRAGTSGEVGGELVLLRRGRSTQLAAGVYRRVEATALPSHPFSPFGSLSGLLLGRDENDYFRGTGAEVRLTPSFAPRGGWEARIFTERQDPLDARATASLRRLVDRDFEVRENLDAEPIRQWGATLTARREWDGATLNLRGELELHGEMGDRDFLRPLVRVRADRYFGPSTRVGLSGTGGVAMGDLPVQRLWQIGGGGTVRGHDPATLRGESLFLLRGEIQRGSPARSLSLFGDLGWAGDREALGGARPLRGFGIGLSQFDESLRIEVTHGVGTDGIRLYFRYGAGR